MRETLWVGLLWGALTLGGCVRYSVDPPECYQDEDCPIGYCDKSRGVCLEHAPDGPKRDADLGRDAPQDGPSADAPLSDVNAQDLPSEDRAVGDVAASDLPRVDQAPFETGAPDGPVADTAAPDLASPDLPWPDALLVDAGCPIGLTRCGTRCIDLAEDIQHCGGCYDPCPAEVSDTCQKGECVCGPTGAPCGLGLDCVLGSCLCLPGGRCSGCCSGNACVVVADQSASSCGNQGQACQTCDDGLFCTASQCTSTGTCAFVHVPFFCLIEGQCYNHGDYRSPAQCLACDIQTAEGRVSWTPVANPGCVTTFAGANEEGQEDGDSGDARFRFPFRVAVSSAGDNIYLADRYNHRVRLIQNKTVSTLAGSSVGYADGAALAAQFNAPMGIAVASNGTVYVGDTGNNRIRVVAGGLVTTLAGNGTDGLVDGNGASASFFGPYDVALDAAEEFLYVADRHNHAIRRVEVATGQVITLAGDGMAGADNGTGTAARFRDPHGLAVSGNTLYVADLGNHRIRQIDLTTVQVSTLVGSNLGYADGPVNSAQFNGPCDVEVVSTGSSEVDGLYVADHYNNRIRRLDGNQVSTVAGSGQTTLVDGPVASAGFHFPTGLAFVGPGSLFVVDSYHHCLRLLTLAGP